jgi:hypothetical protein
MSAAPDTMPPSFDHRDKVIEAQLALIEENAHIIRGLRKQNERLKEEKLNVELEASLEIAKHKFTLAQMTQRVALLEKSVAALDEAQNRTGNIVAGLPTRDEFTLLHNDYYAHSAGCSCR